MNLASFIAWRYLRFKHKDKNISFMIKVCFLGIFVGTFALMVTLIITNGFERVIHEKMQGINAQINISAPSNRLSYEEIRDQLIKEYGAVVTGIGGYSLKQAILSSDDSQTVMILKGVHPEHEATVTNLASKVILPSEQSLLSDLLADDGIIIGYKTAQQQNLHVGDEITLMIPEPGGKKRILLKKQQFTIKGIFNVGLEEYDSNFAFISLSLMQELYDEQGVDCITMTLNQQKASQVIAKKSGSLVQRMVWRIQQFFNRDLVEQTVISSLRDRLPHLQVVSWKELYPAIVSSLKLEKVVMFLIIMLISLVASMNMISLLFMQIQQKQRDIAILKTMGLPARSLRNIFLYLGMSVTIVASAAGLGCAALVGYLLERYPCIQLPDVYYVSYLPARMELELFVIVFLVTLVIGFFATWFPAQRSRQLLVAEVLRQG